MYDESGTIDICDYDLSTLFTMSLKKNNISNLDLETTFTRIQALFGVDKKYLAIRNLIQSLQKLVLAGAGTDLLRSDNGFEFSDDLEALDAELAEKSLHLSSAAGVLQNPAKGQLSVSPVASAILQNVHEDIFEQYAGICILLVHHLACDSLSKETLNRLADKVRISARRYEGEVIYKLLPKSGKDPSAFVSNFRTINLNLKEQYKQDQEYTELIDALLLLANVKIRKKRQPVNPVSNIENLTQGYSPNFLSNTGEVSPLFLGVVTQEFEDSSDDYGDSFKEAPSSQLIYQEDFNLDRLDLPDLAFEEIARQAGYWVDKNSQLSCFNRSVLNPIERNRLVNKLLYSLECDIFEESVFSVLIAISFATGLEVLAVCRAALGNDHPGSVFTYDGCYIRNVWNASEADKRNNKRTQLKKNTDLLSHIDLQMPGPIRVWFAKYRDRLRFYSNLGSVIGLQEELIIDGLKSRVKSFREQGRYHITLPRIEAALPTGLTIRYRNPVITTLLAGSIDQPPPVLMYYHSVSDDDLRDAYETVSNSLFSVELL
ncbi:MAG: hypothetical protein HOM14_02470 [Gammaproteobacteria bacterium]|nr:hypothetical protein [Gammaproteobacteria bacterium]MBT3724758.1 hypothetical protein [Gammaproteobacteria bacterium]MBT4075660.1 hypothetical protein [Gammaproteobacteria bacterium]MBT4448785.1 hypothetical protein [Gammaproteobacteria bacterium]MBT4860637.1 hypothetical protein [Gammaproteobacteria bacterium]